MGAQHPQFWGARRSSADTVREFGGHGEAGSSAFDDFSWVGVKTVDARAPVATKSDHITQRQRQQDDTNEHQRQPPPSSHLHTCATVTEKSFTPLAYPRAVWTAPDYRLRQYRQMCTGPTTSKEPTKDGCKILRCTLRNQSELEIIFTLLRQIGIPPPTVAPCWEALYKDRQSNRRVGVF